MDIDSVNTKNIIRCINKNCTSCYSRVSLINGELIIKEPLFKNGTPICEFCNKLICQCRGKCYQYNMDKINFDNFKIN